MATGGTASERLLDTAARRFRRYGLRRTSVESITAAAGTGKGSLYLHYPSKEALYLETVRRAVEDFATAAAKAMARHHDAPRRLRVLVETAISHYQRDELLSAPLLDDRELVDARAAVLARDLQRDRITRLIHTTLEDGRRRGTLRANLDTDACAAVLFEIGWAIVRSHLAGELALPLPTALRTLNDLIANGTIPRAT